MRLRIGFIAALAAARIAAGDEGPPEGHLLMLAGGLGVTFAGESDHQGRGAGGFLQAEYVFLPRHVFTPRLYGGVLMTFPDRGSCGAMPCDVETKVFFVGAKVRLMAPIPYVGPFIEIGVGASLGYLRTQDSIDLDETVRGAAIHIPVTVGLALGRQHEFDLELSYLVHPAQQQVGGAFAFGVGIPLP